MCCEHIVILTTRARGLKQYSLRCVRANRPIRVNGYATLQIHLFVIVYFSVWLVFGVFFLFIFFNICVCNLLFFFTNKEIPSSSSSWCNVAMCRNQTSSKLEVSRLHVTRCRWLWLLIVLIASWVLYGLAYRVMVVCVIRACCERFVKAQSAYIVCDRRAV